MLKKSDIEGASELGAQLEREPSTFLIFKTKKFSNKREQLFYDKYINTGIALDFTFDITEDNMESTQIDFLRTITNGSASLSLSATNDRSRESTRKFVLSETFADLLYKPMACTREEETPNLLYPVSGSIGLYDVIDTFIDLNQDVQLQSKPNAPAVYTNTLEFITLFSGSGTPKVMLSPPGQALHLMDASLTNSVMRKDNNTLVIGLSFAPKEEDKLAAEAITPFAKGTATSAEKRALGAIQQQRIDNFYDKFGQTLNR